MDNKSNLLIVGAIVLSAAFTQSAVAKVYSSDTAVVEYKMSELTTQAGIEGVKARIAASSALACENADIANYPRSQRMIDRCARRTSKGLWFIIDRSRTSAVFISMNEQDKDRIFRAEVKLS